MDWFRTQQKINPIPQNNILTFPHKVIEVWECKICCNTFYQKTSNFSPFQKSTHIQSNIELENINIRLAQCSEQKFMKIGFKNKKFAVTNQAKIYCKGCVNHDQLLGEFKPQIDLIKIQFHYSLIPNDENITKTKLILGKSNRVQISQNESKINPSKKFSLTSQKQNLKQLKREMQNYLILWYLSRNINIYDAYLIDSKKKKYDFLSMHNFMMNLAPQNQKKEQDKKIIKNKFKMLSSSLVHESQNSFTH